MLVIGKGSPDDAVMPRMKWRRLLSFTFFSDFHSNGAAGNKCAVVIVASRIEKKTLDEPAASRIQLCIIITYVAAVFAVSLALACAQ